MLQLSSNVIVKTYPQIQHSRIATPVMAISPLRTHVSTCGQICLNACGCLARCHCKACTLPMIQADSYIYTYLDVSIPTYDHLSIHPDTQTQTCMPIGTHEDIRTLLPQSVLEAHPEDSHLVVHGYLGVVKLARPQPPTRETLGR